MADYVRTGTCGACSEFEFQGNNKKGYCRYYGRYFWDNDSCSHYSEDSRRMSSGSSSCFLTSACCQHKNLPDDCEELTTLRNFRDTYLISTAEGQKLVTEYYEIAPALVEKIDRHPSKDMIYEDIFSSIHFIIDLIDQQNYDTAVAGYKNMVITVQHAVNK